jgi:NADPH:quinone reductase-like Zn-dependent oxidoreductase
VFRVCKDRRRCHSRGRRANYRDHLVSVGKYFVALDRHTIPLSDGAGDVVAIGAAVTKVQPGDRVAGTFLQVWEDGPRPANADALGVPLDGMLAEYITLHEDGVVAVPHSLSFEEAATLPCAAVTAWNALVVTRLRREDRHQRVTPWRRRSRRGS